MQESLKQQQPEAALAYESPQMRLVPVRGNSAILVMSGKINSLDPEIIDFEASSANEQDALRNYKFNDWSNTDGNSFF